MLVTPTVYHGRAVVRKMSTVSAIRVVEGRFAEGANAIWRLPDDARLGVVPAGMDPLVARILAARGIVGEQAEAFLAPTLQHMHDPSGIPDLDRAAEAIFDAVRSGERVAVYGDYDVDGVTGTTILCRTIREIDPDARVVTHIPHRTRDGYGVHEAALRRLHSDNVSMVVTVDCGITAVEQARVARELGLRLIITDHHTPPESDCDIPDAFAVVHPGRPGSAYPFGGLCGAGVAYKLAWRLATIASGTERVGERWRQHLIAMLAPAALGTIADIVPLRDENRAIARFGLSRVRRCGIVGLSELIEASGIAKDRNIDEVHVGFRLGPRLNAAGRMDHAEDALELMLTEDRAKARRIADRLCELNERRRDAEKRIVDEACKMAEERGMTGADRRAIVLAHPDWHVGVIGIACARLVERYHRPVILMGESEGHCHGSGRSVQGVNLHDALSACAPLLDSYGGHEMAAGLRLKADRLNEFTDTLTAFVCGVLEPEHLAPRISIDCDARLAELGAGAARQLEQLAPFGRGNPQPIVRLGGLRVARAEAFGRAGGHLSLHVRDGDAGSSSIVRLVGWNVGEWAASLPAGTKIEALVTPRVNSWGGRESVEPTIHDYRFVR